MQKNFIRICLIIIITSVALYYFFVYGLTTPFDFSFSDYKDINFLGEHTIIPPERPDRLILFLKAIGMVILFGASFSKNKTLTRLLIVLGIMLSLPLTLLYTSYYLGIVVLIVSGLFLLFLIWQYITKK